MISAAGDFVYAILFITKARKKPNYTSANAINQFSGTE